jgi:hypothetical protein
VHVARIAFRTTITPSNFPNYSQVRILSPHETLFKVVCVVQTNRNAPRGRIRLDSMLSFGNVANCTVNCGKLGRARFLVVKDRFFFPERQNVPRNIINRMHRWSRVTRKPAACLIRHQALTVRSGNRLTSRNSSESI